MESSDIPATGPPPAPPAARRSFFREVPWRWTDVLIGFAPMIVLSLVALLVALLIDPARLLVVRFRYYWLPLFALPQAWWLAYPLWMAHRRHAGSPQLPRPRTPSSSMHCWLCSPCRSSC